ncbi:MAG: tRNA (guanosine(37)-N1)-methyltransferase TrmD, partial [Verrucomicrobia bacterium]|nr:tRNA (guanosine(37)-N1)-methyltransferase TrmD [Verrucomicrobiota bacterium]
TEFLVNDELSIGDYVLSNGAIAAAVVVDAIARLVPGVLGDGDSARDESFSSGTLEYPQYTRPHQFRGWTVPQILVSGNHRAIREWRANQARQKTQKRRPDLLQGS